MSKSTIIQLVIASFVVGAAMAYFQVTPVEVVTTAFTWGKDLITSATGPLGTVLSYILLGAVLVVPIWLVFYLWGGRGKGSE